MQMHYLIILCFLFTFTAAADDPDHIFINCGGAALSGRRRSGDAVPKGSSTASTVKGEFITAVDPLPYKTARVSRSQFSYSFQLNPGQKFIRLHFNPANYNGFQSFTDLFTVEAGPFTLLANFSASITARALGLNILAKEFCIITQENQPLNIVFSPETTAQSNYNYAFINGIEIMSVPSTLSYCHGGDSGVHVLGQKSVIYVDNTTALERVYHQNIKWGSLSFGNDIGGMFGMWASFLKGKAKHMPSNLSWRVFVDVGFRYLIRIHLFEIGLNLDFMLMIDNNVALTSADMLQQRGNQSILWYNYMVMVKGKKREGKRVISISLHSQHEFLDRQGPLEGFEVFKLSNHDLSLASPNPLPPRGDSPPQSIRTLLRALLGRNNAIATAFFTTICLVNILVHLLHKMWGTEFFEEENEPSAMAKRLCHQFSLAEIQSATENFHYAFFLGKGGFGNVYKGFIDNGREIVAIKRLKPDSKQGEKQFWTEVEMLSELRHVNLVSLIGYCIEQQEMILVYEYMPYGTLADHLFKHTRKSNDCDPLSWKQRLKICIGAGRALDYLHMGHGIIHRDVKSSNILLDEKFVAKVSDFGLAKTGFGSESQSQHSTHVRGTYGYLDPNYCETHKPTKKSDTYSFGVVLLEVLCGRRALERGNEEEKCHLPTWAMDNISKGQVDDIVAPSLRGEISSDSLKTFVKVTKRCLHDEPRKRPAIARVVMKLELALQQQEMAESLVSKERTSVEDLFSSTDKSQKKNMNFMAPNEKMNIVDALPQMENVTTSAHNEIRNVTDALPCTDNDRTIISDSTRPMASSYNLQTDTSLPREQMINSGRKDVRKSMMLRISRKLWPWDAFWKTKKPSKKTNVIDIAVSAPMSHRTNNIITPGGNIISDKRTDGMILTPTLRIFSFKEVKIATRNFSEDKVISVGSFGKVYKGWILEKSSAKKGSGSAVAIKKLNRESTQGFKDWQSEVTVLGRLCHPNLVKLLGYGYDDEVLFLVYEYIPCGTLADHLYKLARNSNDYPLSWKQRLNICIGVGRALDYLHSSHGIIHCGVKASNILLDEKFEAKVSDFSLAVTGSGSESQTQDSTNLIDTPECIDPNYSRTRKLTITSDTYSFGVMLLEVLCGKPAVESSNVNEKCSLTMLVMDNISKGQIDDIVAPCLRGEISPDSLKTFVKVAVRCLHDDQKNRPATAHIVSKLELALQQQERVESLPLKDKTCVERVSSSTDTSQKGSMSFMVPYEKINVGDDASPSPAGQMLAQPNLRVFTFLELKGATRNFRADSVLGEGGFGKVYKGCLDEKASGKSGSGTQVAVKKLHSESMQGFQEWQSEVNFLGRLSHPNLVRLLGYGWEDKELLLVYEFMPKGSLENHLFGRGASVHPLPWETRLKILIGAASGLAFLHALDRKVIYRDFKASNILLDGSYHAKISDFGLAKLGPTESKSHVTTQVMGTYGYAAPEYVATGHLYVKSDVYGFGVVLVEMLTGLRALDTNRPSGQHNLVDWIKPHLSERRKLKHIIDVRLEGHYPSKHALQIAQLALNCLESEPKNRPSMQEIVETLERIGSSNDRPRERRVHSSPQVPNRRAQQHLQYRSPLHPRPESTQAYPLPLRT